MKYMRSSSDRPEVLLGEEGCLRVLALLQSSVYFDLCCQADCWVARLVLGRYYILSLKLIVLLGDLGNMFLPCRLRFFSVSHSLKMLVSLIKV
ncbi:hypothetical protein DsansV1_C24g0184551 [Dioscorea sansibarensis]